MSDKVQWKDLMSEAFKLIESQRQERMKICLHILQGNPLCYKWNFNFDWSSHPEVMFSDMEGSPMLHDCRMDGSKYKIVAKE